MSLHSGAPHRSSRLFRYAAHRSRTLVRFGAAVLLATSLSSISFAQRGPSITVRVLDSKNGKPLKGVLLLADAPSRNLETEGKGRMRLLATETTNADGVAAFHLSEPIAEIIISYGDADVGRCTPSLPFATGAILKTGIIGSNECSGKKFQYMATPKPGELVLFGKKWSWWERTKQSE